MSRLHTSVIDCSLFGVLSLGLATAFALPTRPGDAASVAVVFPPWVAARDAILKATAAGSSLVEMGRFPFIVIVRPWSPAFAGAVRHTGGWLLLDAGNMRGCARAKSLR